MKGVTLARGGTTKRRLRGEGVPAAMRARATASLALLGLQALGGCGLIVGDPVGDYVFPSDASADDADEHDGTAATDEGSDGPFSDNGSSPDADAEATAPEDSGGAEVGTGGGDAAAEVGTGGGDAAAEASGVEAGQATYFCNGSVYTLSTSVANGTYALKSYAGFYLDDPSAGGVGTGLDQWAYTGNNQQWTVTLVSNGQYKILAQNGLALTVGSGTGVQLTLQTYTGASTQLWGFTTNGSYYDIVNTASCLAMDDDGGGAILPIAVDATTFSNQTDTSHSWTLATPSSITAPLANGTYQFLDAAGYSLDDESGGGAGTMVGQRIYATSNQQWTVTLVSGVQYKIIGDGSAALTATTGNGPLANLSAYTGASDQLWVFVPNGSTYNVINVGSYMALADASGGSGVQDQQWGWYTNAVNEQWSIGAAPQTECSHISVTKNTYVSGYSGYVTWENTGSVAEANPQLTFTVPSAASGGLDTSACALDNQGVPSSITAVGCTGSGTTVTYAFVGSLAASSSIAIYYSTNQNTEAAATGISVAANSCQ